MYGKEKISCEFCPTVKPTLKTARQTVKKDSSGSLDCVEPHDLVCSDLYGFPAAARLFSMKTWSASEGDAKQMTPPISKKENSMKRHMQKVVMAIVLMGSSMAAFAGNVRTDYDHTVNFSQYNTYSWGKVKSTDPFFGNRIQQQVDKELQAKGWTLKPTGGAATVFATDNIHDQQEVQTMYDGMGGGWGWGPGLGSGIATTTTTDQNVGNLVIDVFDGSSKKLLWRGLSTDNLSSNAGKNTKMLDGDINNMFKNFPPKAGK